MATPIPVQVIPAVLADTYCPTKWQELNLAIMAAKWSVDLGNVSTFILGPTAPDHTQYPNSIWIKTDAYGAPERAYMWSGDVPNPLNKWISPHRVPPSSKELRIFEGTPAEVDTYEGGTSGTATIDSGPFWEIAAEMTGRVPIGVNSATDLGAPPVVDTLPNVEPRVNNAEVGTNLLTFENLPHHQHPFASISAGDVGNADSLTNGAGKTLAELFTIPTSYTGAQFMDGTGVSATESHDRVNLFSLDAVDESNGGFISGREVERFSTMPPGVGLYFMRRTIRAYYSEL
jgi:hypothetical protein